MTTLEKITNLLQSEELIIINTIKLVIETEREFVLIMEEDCGGYYVSEFLKSQKDFAGCPAFEGTLEGCLEYVLKTY